MYLGLNRVGVSVVVVKCSTECRFRHKFKRPLDSWNLSSIYVSQKVQPSIDHCRGRPVRRFLCASFMHRNLLCSLPNSCPALHICASFSKMQHMRVRKKDAHPQLLTLCLILLSHNFMLASISLKLYL